MAIPSKTNFPRAGGQGRVDSFTRFGSPTGNVLYVHHDGTSTGPGFAPETAYSTLAAAVGAARANSGDVVVILPSHIEGIGNEQITIDKAGLKIVGLGEGADRPRFDFDHANASIDITASGVTIENVTLLPSVTAVLVGIDVNAAVTNTTLRKIESLPGEDGAGVDEFAKTIDIKAGCTRTTVEDCLFTQHASAAGVISNVALTGASDMVTVRRCEFWAAGAGLVASVNGDTTLSTRILVDRCLFTADAEPGVELLTGTTGVIRDCDFFTNLATDDAPIVADGCALFRNAYVEVGGEAQHADPVGVPSIDD